MNEVTIRAKVNKEAPLNPMALAGARMFSVEEANRYAGGFDDPARLVTAFIKRANNQLMKMCDELWVFGDIANGVFQIVVFIMCRHCEPLVAKQSIVQDFWIASSFLLAMTRRDNLKCTQQKGSLVKVVGLSINLS